MVASTGTMGVKDSFQSSGLKVEITFCVALVSNICNWISFTTSSWYSGWNNNYYYYGLWRTCSGGSGISCSFLDGTANSSLAAVQAFAVFGFVSLNIGFFLLVLFIFWGSCRGNTDTKWASAILLIVSAVTWLISVIVFGADFYHDRKDSTTDLGFSFGLAIVSLILSAVSGVLLILEASGSGSIGSK